MAEVKRDAPFSATTLAGFERRRLFLSDGDRQTFFTCIDGQAAVEGDSKVAAAYRFFRAHISSSGPNGDAERLDPVLISRVILERLSIVDIVTESDDNPNQIFESLNATSVRLTQGDLLRNHIFMLLPTRGEDVYRRIWLPMERMLGDETSKVWPAWIFNGVGSTPIVTRFTGDTRLVSSRLRTTRQQWRTRSETSRCFR